MKALICPLTKVNLFRFIPAVIVGFIFLFGFDYVVHHILLMDIYKSTPDLWRPESDMQSYFPLILGYQALLSAIVGLIYTRNHEGKGVLEGIRFGIFIGALIALLNAAAYIWMPIPLTLALSWAASGFGVAIGLGVIFSLIYKKV